MHQVIELRLGVLPKPSRCQGAVVPVIAGGEAVNAEWVSRDSSVDRPAPSGIHVEGFTSATPTHLILLVAAHEVVFVGIQGEQDPEATLRIYVQDEEVAIIGGSNLDLGSVSRKEATVIADPKADRRIVLGCSRRVGGDPREEQRKEQRGYHGTSLQPRFATWKHNGTLAARQAIKGTSCEPRAITDLVGI
jgi:hypothetical protein